MSSNEWSSDNLPSHVEAAFPQTIGLRNISPLRMAKIHAPEEYVDRARNEIATVLYFWAYRSEMWTIVGFTASPADRLSAAAPVAHPIVDVLQSQLVVRCQPLSLSERDTLARHAFMRYLTAQGLPVPELVARPEDVTYAVVPFVSLTDPQQASGFTYVLENPIYELQRYMPGRRFVTDGPSEDIYLEAAAQTLAALHNASFAYVGPAHEWLPERGTLPIAQIYLGHIAEASRDVALPRSVASALRRLARAGMQWTAQAIERIESHPALPRLHVHGDYQPHNLAFDGDRVIALYDFDAMHRDWRVIELAYALLAFTGLRWEDDTAASVSEPALPLVERGLDLERARAFLDAYGRISPPQPEEADLLGDALLLVLPVIFSNGVAEDLVYPERMTGLGPSPRESRARVEWAETFPGWVEAHRSDLRDAWVRRAVH
ncbi:MAG TPA: phosphotransferase [Ktedonobacterales bacterium]